MRVARSYNMPPTRRVSSNDPAHYEALGSEGEHRDHVTGKKEDGKSKDITSSIGGFFKSSYTFMKTSTTNMANKVSAVNFKEGFGKAGTAVKGGFLTAVDKSKEIGGKIADSTVEFGGKVKEGAIAGFVMSFYHRKRPQRQPRRALRQLSSS